MSSDRKENFDHENEELSLGQDNVDPSICTGDLQNLGVEIQNSICTRLRKMKVGRPKNRKKQGPRTNPFDIGRCKLSKFNRKGNGIPTKPNPRLNTKNSDLEQEALEIIQMAEEMGLFSSKADKIIFKSGSIVNKILTKEESSDLEREVTEEELDVAIRHTGDDKAPGPDGINNGVLKTLWKWIRKDCFKFMEDFLEKGIIPKGTSSSFITLVPKIQDPLKITDYRPISLINCSFKLISKILANRLECYLGKIIGSSQSGFIKGRQISESILIANEIEHSMKCGKIKGIILKLDFEKAFDSVDWNFLLDTLNALGFGHKWISWIKMLISSVKASVLINGSPSKEFHMNLGRVTPFHQLYST